MWLSGDLSWMALNKLINHLQLPIKSATWVSRDMTNSQHWHLGDLMIIVVTVQYAIFPTRRLQSTLHWIAWHHALLVCAGGRWYSASHSYLESASTSCCYCMHHPPRHIEWHRECNHFAQPTTSWSWHFNEVNVKVETSHPLWPEIFSTTASADTHLTHSRSSCPLNIQSLAVSS